MGRGAGAARGSGTIGQPIVSTQSPIAFARGGKKLLTQPIARKALFFFYSNPGDRPTKSATRRPQAVVALGHDAATNFVLIEPDGSFAQNFAASRPRASIAFERSRSFGIDTLARALPGSHRNFRMNFLCETQSRPWALTLQNSVRTIRPARSKRILSPRRGTWPRALRPTGCRFFRPIARIRLAKEKRHVGDRLGRKCFPATGEGNGRLGANDWLPNRHPATSCARSSAQFFI